MRARGVVVPADPCDAPNCYKTGITTAKSVSRTELSEFRKAKAIISRTSSVKGVGGGGSGGDTLVQPPRPGRDIMTSKLILAGL